MFGGVFQWLSDGVHVCVVFAHGQEKGVLFHYRINRHSRLHETVCLLWIEKIDLLFEIELLILQRLETY